MTMTVLITNTIKPVMIGVSHLIVGAHVRFAMAKKKMTKDLI